LAPHLALEVDAFAAFLADDALALEPGKILRPQLYFHVLHIEKVLLAHLAISEHLLLVLALDLRMHLARQRLRRLTRRDAHSLAALYIDEGCGELAPIAKLQRALSQPAPGHDRDRIGCAAVDLDERHQPLAMFAARVVNA